jgi:hypothetical protein
MKRILTAFSLTALAFVVQGCSMLAPKPEWELTGWTLHWHKEFDGPEINRGNWTFDQGGGGWGNNE